MSRLRLSAAIAAVLVLAQSFAGSAERFDALFTAYRAAEQGRVARGQMRAAVTYVPSLSLALPRLLLGG